MTNKWDTSPLRLSAHVQDKLEFEGMIANIGLRMDYVQGQKWYAFNDYDASLGIGNAGMIDPFQTITPDGVLRLSPRLGVSFPQQKYLSFILITVIFIGYLHQMICIISIYPESQQLLLSQTLTRPYPRQWLMN